jgi:hypothetical protein
MVLGFCAQGFGVLNALLVPAIISTTLWFTFSLFTPIWQFQREEPLQARAA